MRVRRLSNPALVIVLQDQCGNLLDSAEVFNLEILNVNVHLKILLKMKDQLHKSLRVKSSALKKIRVSRWNLHMQKLRKHGEESCPDLLVVGVCHNKQRLFDLNISWPVSNSFKCAICWPKSGHPESA